MASAQSTAFRSPAGYSTRPASTAAFTMGDTSIPAMPTVAPLAGDASAPGYVGRQLLNQQLSALTGQQNAALTGIKATAQQGFAGYGGWGFGKDNPDTTIREDLIPNFNPQAPLGEKDKAAYRTAANTANASGMGSSSFANQNIASALQRTSLEAQQVSNQYAAAINQTTTSYANQAASIANQMASLYGSDSAYLVANPPPAPEVPVTMAPGGSTAGTLWQGGYAPDETQLAHMYPGADITVAYDPATGLYTAQGADKAAAAPAPNNHPVPGPGSSGITQSWTGSSSPDIAHLAKGWGVAPSSIRVEKHGNSFYAYAIPVQGMGSSLRPGY